MVSLMKSLMKHTFFADDTLGSPVLLLRFVQDFIIYRHSFKIPIE